MNTSKILLAVTLAVAGTVAVTPAQAASYYIDPADGTFFSAGVFGPSPGGYDFSVPSPNSALTPGPTGNYYIETS
jgi:hypothetical protein